MKVLVTGAAGYLGGHIIRILVDRGVQVRALVLPDDPAGEQLPEKVDLCYGDLLYKPDVKRFFDVAGDDVIVIHAAALISMKWKMDPDVRAINFGGTQNVVDACLARGFRLIHVSSVHAIKEEPHGHTIKEPICFAPGTVTGCYAKTKAEGAALVMDAMQNHGLDAAIVMPSGIVGPGASAHNNVTQMMIEYLRGTLPAGIRGGYDFVDVRDVAQTIVQLCFQKDKQGCYILAGHNVSIRHFFDAIQKSAGKKVRSIKWMVPSWMAYLALPVFSLVYKLKKETPVFTRYGVYTLTTNSDFCNEKAKLDLGFSPRPFEDTIADMVAWLYKSGVLKKA